MPKLTINQRLDALLPKLQDARLLSNRGIGNEIGFYIFDYDAEYEPLVQQYVARLKVQLTSPPHELIVLEINLYRIILDILQQRRVLEKAFELEANKGIVLICRDIAMSKISFLLIPLFPISLTCYRRYLPKFALWVLRVNI
jgi:hypothetical protein